MNELRLDNKVGWGNEIHIHTIEGTYAGSGRCSLKKGGIVQKKPELKELKWPLTVSGNCSTPYVKSGDILIYESNLGIEIRFKLKNINYSRDPHDRFYGNLKYMDPDKKGILYRIKKRVLSKLRKKTYGKK